MFHASTDGSNAAVVCNVVAETVMYDELLMPEKVNLHEADFAAPNIQELNAKQAKAHVTFGRKAATTAISLFAILTFVIDTQIACRPPLDNPIRWNRKFNRYGEIDEHYDGTLIHSII